MCTALTHELPWGGGIPVCHGFALTFAAWMVVLSLHDNPNGESARLTTRVFIVELN
jgi:hypothetical protein